MRLTLPPIPRKLPKRRFTIAHSKVTKWLVPETSNGFFTNDELAECTPIARLLFAGLWTIADKEGRLDDRPKKIKALVLPFDNVDCDDCLKAASRSPFHQPLLSRWQLLYSDLELEEAPESTLQRSGK